MAKSDDLLDRALDAAYAAQTRECDDLQRLPEPLRTVAVVLAAQCVLDNGGLRYFFENDYPWWPPYSLFAHAYRRIGAERDAEKLERAAARFPFADPHLHRLERQRFLDSAQAADLEALDRDHDDVWKLLRGYVETNRAEILGERD